MIHLSVPPTVPDRLLSGGLFEQVQGLPLHPLVVHVVVVLVPLSALGAVAVAARPSWARPYGPLVAVGAVLAALAAYVSQQAGNSLLVANGYSGAKAEALEVHGRWGLYTVVSVAGFALLMVVAAVLARRDHRPPVTRVVAVVAALVGILGTVFTLLAGHSGATSVWGYVFP